jgi:hypothetical protein
MTYTSTCFEEFFMLRRKDNSAPGQTSNSAGGISEKGMAAPNKAKRVFKYTFITN